jgi:hypothetical protein
MKMSFQEYIFVFRMPGELRGEDLPVHEQYIMKVYGD